MRKILVNNKAQLRSTLKRTLDFIFGLPATTMNYGANLIFCSIKSFRLTPCFSMVDNRQRSNYSLLQQTSQIKNQDTSYICGKKLFATIGVISRQ